MVEKKKTYRVNKVATEFNVSWKTIVGHLTEKGFEVESKITAKLDESMYQDLLSFYQMLLSIPLQVFVQYYCRRWQ